ncbi:membrane protein YfhO [Dyella sp. OK004]|uniref:YfhO family protein n=1 Tax=Dyella sp. OK004 TaxID=1855292 RepID=UPI0008EE141C|nr:YfhO family protein [Dyella sp. OK004]SFR92713.1 membrane protein YfhO [Dyella sp. OK004]
MTWWQRPGARLFGALLLIWLLLNLPVLAGIKVLPWDASDQFYPTVYFNAHSLRHGLAPWWNPHIYGGYPQIADPQGMLFSPLLMSWMMLPSSPGSTWFAWGVLLHVLMGGAAVLALLRQMGANPFGGLMGATVFMAGGVAASRLEHVPIVLAYGYAPVVLLALRHFLARPRWQRGLVFGLTAGAMLTQLVQLTYLLALMLAAYGAAATVAHWRYYTPRDRRQWCTGMGLALLLALAVGLPQLVLSLAFTVLSNRAELPLAAAAPASLDLRAFLTLLNPNALHALRGTYAGPTSLVEAYLYIGVMPMLLLAGCGLAWRQPQQRRQMLFFGVVGLIAILYMLGVNTPFYGWLYSWLPGIKQFRRPSDGAYLLNFSFAIVVGLSASHFKLESRCHLTWLLMVAAAWLLLASFAMRDAHARWQTATLAASLFAIIALWRVRRSGITNAGRATWLLALLVVDYRCFNLNGVFNQAPDSVRAWMRDDAAAFITDQTRAAGRLLPPRVEPVDTRPYWDNLVALRGLHSTQGYNPLRYALYEQWYGARESSNQAWPVTLYNTAPGSAMSALLGAEYLVRDTTLKSALWMPSTGYERVFTGRHGEVWRNSRAYPRLLTPVEMRTSEAPPSPEVFASTDFNQTFWLTPRDAQDRQLAEAQSSSCNQRLQLQDATTTPTSLTVRTRSEEGPGWLVVSELDFPGWHAQVDGAPLPIHRANGMFRAVCVPAGQHTLEFRFHPWAMVAETWQRYRRDAARL